jgi:diguanylate cyclase (GGDEF)-like protein
MSAQSTILQPVSTESVHSCNSILIAEDDAMSRKILQSWLENWGYRVTVAENGAMAWNILQREDSPELLILDWVMPEIDGIELCRKIRDRERSPYRYILLATARNEKQDLVRGLEAGADDYLTKPLERNELRARLRVGERILTLQRDLIQAREDLRFQATHDALTDIWNRGTILELLQRELERAARTQSSTGVLMLDLDHFKQVNDTYGHLSGDVVLREVAQRISQAVRSYDLVARYGGEEFLIVLPGCDKDQTQGCAERVRAAIASAPIVAHNSEIPVTVSIGAMIATGGETAEIEILAAADAALYQAKNSGRDRVILSSAGRQISLASLPAPERLREADSASVA